jgi:hypothetical protein
MANVIKLFTDVIYESCVFNPSKPFQPTLMFVGKARIYHIKEPYRCSTLG